MTIIEAIKTVLQDEPNGLTSYDIYEKIIEQSLYQFGAKNPVGVVNGEIRRHCMGLDFPTALPIKHFAIVGKEGKKLKFIIANNTEIKNSNQEIVNQTKTIYENTEILPEEKIANAIDEHLQQIKQELLYNIMHNHPNFFGSIEPAECFVEPFAAYFLSQYIVTVLSFR